MFGLAIRYAGRSGGASIYEDPRRTWRNQAKNFPHSVSAPAHHVGGNAGSEVVGAMFAAGYAEKTARLADS